MAFINSNYNINHLWRLQSPLKYRYLTQHTSWADIFFLNNPYIASIQNIKHLPNPTYNKDFVFLRSIRFTHSMRKLQNCIVLNVQYYNNNYQTYIYPWDFKFTNLVVDTPKISDGIILTFTANSLKMYECLNVGIHNGESYFCLEIPDFNIIMNGEKIHIGDKEEFMPSENQMENEMLIEIEISFYPSGIFGIIFNNHNLGRFKCQDFGFDFITGPKDFFYFISARIKHKNSETIVFSSKIKPIEIPSLKEIVISKMFPSEMKKNWSKERVFNFRNDKIFISKSEPLQLPFHAHTGRLDRNDLLQPGGLYLAEIPTPSLPLFN